MRAHLRAAEPEHLVKQRPDRFAAVRWQVRHCQGRARCRHAHAMSCPPKATGTSSLGLLTLGAGAAPRLRPRGAESESRSARGPQLLAASVTRATHQAMAATASSWSDTARRTPAGTRCRATAALASLSASSFPRLSLAVRRSPLLSRRRPTCAALVCAGIHAASAGGSPSVAAKMAAQARAVSRPAPTALSLPAQRTSSTDLQSVLNAASPNACTTAWSKAHVSAPKMVSIHGGGTPCADARMVPLRSMATNAHPVRLKSGVGPSKQEPSG